MLTVKVFSDLRGIARVEKRATEGMKMKPRQMAEAIVHDIDQNWSPNSPSPIGDPPASVSGELAEKVEIEQARDRRGRFSSGFLITYYAPYAQAMETLYYDTARYAYKRPFLVPAVERAGPRYETMWERLLK